MEGNPFDENDLASDYRYHHYLQNITRIEIKQEVLTRKYYTDTGTTSHYQILLPTQLLKELLQALHGHNSNHPGITKKLDRNTTTIVSQNTLKNGSVTAKLAFKPKGSTMTSSEP